MIELDPHRCRHINGGNIETTTSTELITSNKHMHCQCVCTDEAEQMFLDESDDIWVWWLIVKPYRVITGLFGW